MRLIALDIRSLHNVGAIFRSADAFSVEKLYLCGITGVPPRKEISKTALGSEQRVVWEYTQDVNLLVEELKQNGFLIIALETGDRSVSIISILRNLNIKVDEVGNKKIVLIVGNEVEGISTSVLDLCDSIVNIPMTGDKKSLNVSVATGIALFAIQTNLS